MRKLLITLPLAISSIALAQETLPSLHQHVHGVASLDIVIDNNKLQLDLDTPAINIVGFEHEANTPEERNKVTDAKKELNQPVALFGINSSANCELDELEVDIPLLEHDHPHDDEDADHDHEHSDIDAEYSFTCNNINELKSLDLSTFFAKFPATEKINVQLVAPSGQNAFEITAANPKITW